MELGNYTFPTEEESSEENGSSEAEETTETSSSSNPSESSDIPVEMKRKTSWYAPFRRRNLQGASRRNTINTRRVTFTQFDESDSDDSSDDMGSFHFSEKQGNSTDQLFALLDRSVKFIWRHKVAFLLEIIVPILFVVVCVILWAIWGSDDLPTQYFYNDSSGDSAFVNYVIPDFGVTAAASIFCTRDGEWIAPFKTPCLERANCSSTYLNRLPFLKEGQLCIQEQPNVVSFQAFAYFFLNTFNQYMPVIPDLTALLFAQWCAQLDYPSFAIVQMTTATGMKQNTRISALLSYGMLLFAGPDTSTINNVRQYFKTVCNTSTLITDLQNYKSIEEAKEAYKGKELPIWAIIYIDSMTEKNFNTTIYLGSEALPSFANTINPAYEGGSQLDTTELYATSGFYTLEKMLAEYYVNEIHKAELYGNYFIFSLPSPPYIHTAILTEAGKILPLIFSLAFLYSVSYQTKKIVQEKELRVREAMLIMGLKQWTFYVVDFIVQTGIFVFVCLISAIILKATFVVKSDFLIIFLVFFVFSLTTIPLSGLISTFFSKARLAALVSPVIYFILVIPVFAMTNAKGGIIIGFSIFSPSGFAALLQVFLQHESTTGFVGKSFQSTYDDPNCAVLIGMLAADFFIYYLILLYLDQVIPKEWGTSRHPLFFIIEPCKLCCCKQEKMLEGGPDARDPDGFYEDDDYINDPVYMAGLRKVYKRSGKKFAAVDNFYWGLEYASTSVLLGHNGAGKTTVLNMITGMIEPDEGDCIIGGISTRLQMNEVRKGLGFCPQHNILWPKLTCREHLTFYAKIKGQKGWELEDAVCRMLYETDLLEKIDQPAESLSGGQKRKLSIAIAFVGGSSVVFLDEPTAGLDVSARRYTWELIKRMASMHTIMLTTHYMDEADILGSRVGIMCEGRLCCSGSGLFLKSRIGIGYQIVVSVDPELDPSLVDNVVLNGVESSKVLGHNGCELSYQLPYESISQFPALLSLLDSQEENGVRGYAISATTLEEVFLAVTNTSLYQEEDVNADLDVIWEFEKMSTVFWSQMRAMFIKRFWNALRDHRMQCFQIICPVLCILIAMLLNLINYSIPTTITLDYNLFEDYSQPINIYTTQCSPLFGSSPTIENANFVDTKFHSALELNAFMLDEWFNHDDLRLGAISCLDNRTYTNKYGVVPVYDPTNPDAPPSYYYRDQTNNTYLFMHNTSSYHQGAINIASFYKTFMKYFKGDDYVMTFNAGRFENKQVLDALTLMFIGALIMIPLSFLPSNPVSWIVKEKECGSRHLQNVAGLNYIIYWFCNFIFDFAAYVITMLLCIIIFAIFNRKELIGADRVGATFVVFIAYGVCSTTMAYALSFIFKEHSTAQTVVMGLSFILGFLFLMIVYILQLEDKTTDVSEKLRFAFRLIPSYSVGECLLNLLMLDGRIKSGSAKGPWELKQIGWACIYMTIEIPVFSIIVILLDMPTLKRFLQRRYYKAGRKPKIDRDEDSDVEEERLAVYEAVDIEDKSDVVRVINLQKRYSNGKLAVAGLTFSIFPGEVFGFLGTNGAGKTTTIQILCQNFLPTGGTAVICGYDLLDESSEALSCIGYCPQFDGTLDLLTVQEHLEMFCRIRGVSRDDKARVVESLIALCGLTTYRKTAAGLLSGGNRRKLSMAISLTGGPQVIFLDEPSAGMDPVARRGLWTCIQRAASHCSIVLTTHHLEEVEALADIVAIMVGGSLRCIGDKVHLKKKYGSGHEVTIRVGDPELVGRVDDFLAEHFPGTEVKERDEKRTVYQIPVDVDFSDIFDEIQSNKLVLNITDYSVAQTSIEQIFLKISEEAGQEEY